MPSVASTLATMIGLGVGIDYALFIVTRHKLQLGEGMELRESIARATATAGGAVVFAGFTVVIALCSLAFAGIPLVSTLGFTAAIAVVIAVCAATTLLPAMLGALGPRINSLRVQLGKTHPDDAEPHGWRRWAERRRQAALALGDRRAGGPGRPGAADLPARAGPERHQRPAQVDTTARQAYDSLNKGFGPGVNGPLLIASEFDTPEEAKQVLPGLEKAVGGAADVDGGLRTDPRQGGTVAVFTVISKSEPWADETVEPGRRPARHDDPGGAEGDRGQLLRRRPDRRLHRPRDPDRRQAAADDRDRRRAQLHRPARRLPLAAGPDQGGGDEPALGRRGLRHRDPVSSSARVSG